ncbi:hypothetical protein G9A89_021170 [Geosiphon pyriformis]|nr:hypothetical protein G9A89_021170 [Geosiphon pyriformis]
MNSCAKQMDIICWHNNMNNLISVVTETKLKGKIHPWIVDRFAGVRVFTLGLNSGHMGSGVAIIMNSSLAKHVCKVLEVSTVNEFSFVILGGDFNEDRSHKCTSFKKCFDLDLVNFLGGSFFAKLPTWCNSCGVAKTIDYVFLSSNLINAIVDCGMLNVDDFFDTNHKAVFVSMGLNDLLDTSLSSIHKQVNKDHWKFDVKDANELKWAEFRDGMAANASMFLDVFVVAGKLSDLDVIWDIIRKIMILSAGKTFKKKWFKGFDSVFNKVSSRFHKLELLVSKLVKAFCLTSRSDFSGFNGICSELAKARKFYCSSKMLKSKCASFELDKSCTIKSVLEHPFHKVVLDHLVVDDELVLKSELVKSKTRRRLVVSNFSDDWKCQFQSLDYVFNGVFSGVIKLISYDEMCSVISSLPDGKAAGLSNISNKLWKHYNRVVLDMLLVLLNLCLVCELVPGPWKEAWVSMIPKPYEWEGVLTNTYPIALIETAHKIFSKILSDRISLGTTMQSPIFAIGSMVEDALEKNRELWLVLQDMRKAYDLRSLIRIKICNRFIRFFGNIHNNCRNRVMTDFGLTSGYVIKRQGEMYDYRLNSHFVFNTGCVESQAGLTLFFAASAFVDDTIWVGSSQATTQHILNIASEFFRINDISINNNKTVTISVNCWVETSYLTVSDLPISIAKKDESYYYLGIFLSSNGLLVPSLAKTHLDVQFFVNLVLKKAILDKQFSYLVPVVLFSIISYKTRFSFFSDTLICKVLKSKSGLLLDFPNDALHYSSLYDLKTFEQIQAESKLASVIAFANSVGILGCLFSHRCNLFLGGSLAYAFCYQSGTPMSLVLGEINFLKCVSLLKRYDITFVEQLRD